MDESLQYKFNIKLTAKELWQFSMYHANRGFTGIFNIFITIFALGVLVFRWEMFSMVYRLLLVLCALSFTVLQPILLYVKAARQVKTSAVKEPMELEFTIKGILIRQSGNEMEVAWEQVGRAEKTSHILVFYMDRIRAYLLPRNLLGERENEFYEFLRQVLPKERRKKI